MEHQHNEKHGLFEDDGLDTAIANADDTGMVKSQQQILEAEERLPEESEGDE